VSIAQPAKDWVKENRAEDSDEAQLRHLEQRSVLVSLENLMAFEFVKERVEAGRLRLHGWFFDLQAGELLCYNAEKDQFLSPEA
jgi:carbonic anhydrase